MLSSRLAGDLYSDLGRSTWSVSENLPQSSRELLVIEPLGRVVRSKEPQRIVSVDPSINRVSRGGADPIPFISFRSLMSPSLSLVLQRSCDRHAPKLVLAPSLRDVLLLRMHVKSLCHIRSTTNPNSDMAAEAACIPDPQAAWVQ
jgi:hypothetical protein